MARVKQVLTNLLQDFESSEREYVIECLKAAVDYCECQFQESGIDWLPTVATVGLHEEADKFELLKAFLNTQLP